MQEDEDGLCMRLINSIDFDKTTLGEVVSTLLLWCFSNKDIEASVITKYLNAAFDQYHLTNYQINQLFQAHSLCNYRSYTSTPPSTPPPPPPTSTGTTINFNVNKKDDDITETTTTTNTVATTTIDTETTPPIPTSPNSKESIPLLPILSFDKIIDDTNTNNNNNNNNNSFVNTTTTTTIQFNNNNTKDLYNNIFLTKLKSIKESATILTNITKYSTQLKDHIQTMIESFGEEELEPYIIKKSLDYQTNLTKFANQIFQIWPREDRNAILEVIESMILINIYELLFPFNIQKDKEIKESIRLIQKHPIDYLDTDSDKVSAVEWEQAIAELSSINVFQTPRDKVMCILRFSRIVSQGLHSSGKSFGADEFVNCIVYILIKSNPAYLYSNMRSNDLLVSEAEYYFVSISSAMMFIERKYQELKNVEIDESYIDSLSSYSQSLRLYNNNNINDENETTTNTLDSTNTYPSTSSTSPTMNELKYSSSSSIGMEPLLNDENPIHKEVIKTANEILAKLLSIAISEGSYDSRIRSALLRLSMIVSPKEEDGLPFFAIEMAVGQTLFDEKERKRINRGILNVFERTTSNHRVLKVAVATVTGGILLAVTGGLIAPALGALLHLIGASATVFSALTYAGVSGPTLTSLLFGTVGSVMSANRVSKSTAGLERFRVNKIHETFGLHVVLGAIGWIENEPPTNTTTNTNNITDKKTDKKNNKKEKEEEKKKKKN
ncbi:transmembrane protein [Cavenderia fasciculata]|uniref:Transmembrane protein n=1 Tax=Cavenderia fasciculata TaxID=261658 RepID=F4PHI9_CACFS|nr:uncharacterized protein DFA_03421 [Cavenderia fasciculata]EGG25173.1 transmembrane protein [Cavenderia fasciculata]|eukprot:XP_004363024.1 transmembrane protein [Cavenderia fasciculata]